MSRRKLVFGVLVAIVMILVESNEMHPYETNPVLNQMVTEFQQYCPNVDQCYSSANQTIPPSFADFGLGGDIFMDCCSRCTCDDDCGYNCCPDKLTARMTMEEFEKARNSVFDCLYPQFRPYDRPKFNALKSFTFVARCPADYKDENVRQKCLRDYYDFDFTEPLIYMLPLSSIRTQLSYKNYYCWVCNSNINHDENINDLVPWRPSLSCRLIFYTPTITDVTEIPEIVENDDECNLMFDIPEDLQWVMESCHELIDRCNVTGQWLDYDRFTEEACLSYTSQYDDKYKNVHCYFCNGHSVDSVEEKCKVEPTDSGQPSFIALLDFNDLEEAVKEKQSVLQQCPAHSLYDRYTNMCRELHCTHGLILSGTSCSFLVKETTSQYPEAMITDVAFTLDWKEDVTDIKMTPETLRKLTFETVKNDLYNKLDMLEREGSRAIPCNIKTLIKLNRGTESVLQSMFNKSDIDFTDDIESISIIANFITTRGGDMKAAITDFATVFAFPTNIGFFKWSFRKTDDLIFQYTPNEDTKCTYTALDLLRKYNASYETFSMLCDSYSDPRDGKGILPIRMLDRHCNATISLEPSIFSGKFKLPRSNIKTKTDCSVIVRTGDKDGLFEFHDYVETDDDDSVYIPWAEYQAQIEKYITDSQRNGDTSDNDQNELSVLTQVCLGWSLISLLATLLIYCVLPKLRSLPGLNNMALCISLLILQSLALVIATTTVTSEWLCTVIGFLLHFTLLAGFIWMFVCTFHMARTFASLKTQPVSGSSTVSGFAKYTCFVIGSTAFIISLGFVYAASIGNLDISSIYGGSICYIKSSSMILYFIAIPLALVLVANLTMFILVVIKISRLPDMTATSTSERKNLVIFAKLSTVTGITWLFGFLYEMTAVKLFAYLFIITNASQGVFIFLAFVVNKRVYEMLRVLLKEKTRGKYTTNSSQRTVSSRSNGHNTQDTGTNVSSIRF